MIHKLMDIFGRKDANKSSNVQYTNSDLKTEKELLVTDNSVKDDSNSVSQTKQIESMNKNPLSSSDNSNEVNATSENLVTYFKSIAKSTDDRKDCFGCKVTATVFVTSSVLFAIVCVQSRRKEIVFKQSNKRRQFHASRTLSIIQLSLVGALVAFTYGEWFLGKSDNSAKSEDTKV